MYNSWYSWILLSKINVSGIIKYCNLKILSKSIHFIKHKVNVLFSGSRIGQNTSEEIMNITQWLIANHQSTSHHHFLFKLGSHLKILQCKSYYRFINLKSPKKNLFLDNVEGPKSNENKMYLESPKLINQALDHLDLSKWIPITLNGLFNYGLLYLNVLCNLRLHTSLKP